MAAAGDGPPGVEWPDFDDDDLWEVHVVECDSSDDADMDVKTCESAGWGSGALDGPSRSSGPGPAGPR